MTRPYRILQVCTRLAVRGVPRHVLSLAAGLDREEFTVDVLAGRSEPGEGDLWDEARDLGITTWQVPALQRQVDPRRDWVAYRGLCRRLALGQYDLVHTHISKAGILGRVAAARMGITATVHTYHGQVAEVQRPTLVGLVFRWCERAVARRTQCILAVSQDTARACLAMGIGRPDQYRVVYNGVDLARFVGYAPSGGGPADGARTPCLGAIGSLTEEKGFDLLLAAMPAICREHPGARLWIVGGGPQQPHLAQQVHHLGLARSVGFAGIVADVRPWLAGLSVLLVPSRREGLPTVIIEAMAMGVPIVASRVGGIPEAVVDGVTGVLVDPEDPAALARAATAVLADREWGRRLGRAGQDRAVRHFGRDAMLGQVGECYRQLLAAPGVRP